MKKVLKKNLKEEQIKKVEFDRLKYLNKKKIFPKPELVFNAFKHFELKDLNVILLGQDPYIRYEEKD